MTFNWNLLQELLVVAIACSTITVAFIQKTKKFFKNKRWITSYSFVVNMVFGFLFCKSFTSLSSIQSLWVGLFSFIGADTIYRNLEGKLKTHTELREGKKSELINSNNEAQTEQNSKEKEEIVGVISRD